MSVPGFTNTYSQNAGMTPTMPYQLHVDTREPASTDVNYPIGTWWLFRGDSLWFLYSQSTASGVRVSNWQEVGSASGDVVSVLGTTNQITVTTADGVATVSLPSAITAPGSLTTTTTLAAGTALSSGTTITAGTSITATLGDITATNGNFVGSASGKGLLFNSPASSGAAASPVVVNGRSGQATFTSVSIAAAADLTLTITNSAITGSATQVIYSMSGATTGSALSIKSVTNTAGSSAIVVTNGTGATTTTANIVINFLVVN